MSGLEAVVCWDMYHEAAGSGECSRQMSFLVHVQQKVGAVLAVTGCCAWHIDAETIVIPSQLLLPE